MILITHQSNEELYAELLARAESIFRRGNSFMSITIVDDLKDWFEDLQRVRDHVAVAPIAENLERRAAVEQLARHPAVDSWMLEPGAGEIPQR